MIIISAAATAAADNFFLSLFFSFSLSIFSVSDIIIIQHINSKAAVLLIISDDSQRTINIMQRIIDTMQTQIWDEMTDRQVLTTEIQSEWTDR